MKVVEIDELKPRNGGSARFQGENFDATSSFFIVNSPPGKGADKHRHPYEEIFVILQGKIEIIVADEMCIVEHGNIVVVPLNTWHEFKNRSDYPALMINIHPVPRMIQEDWTE